MRGVVCVAPHISIISYKRTALKNMPPIYRCAFPRQIYDPAHIRRALIKRRIEKTRPVYPPSFSASAALVSNPARLGRVFVRFHMCCVALRRRHHHHIILQCRGLLERCDSQTAGELVNEIMEES